jgi:CubicO group peptidase (beta-lactamase class C family)
MRRGGAASARWGQPIHCAAVALAEAERLADRSLRGWIERGRAVGVMVGLSAGEDVVMKAFGSSGTERLLGPDTILEIGSITKTFTGLLLADMAGRGEVRLEDPIARYLPFEPPRADREVTLLDLATHTARLPTSGLTFTPGELRCPRPSPRPSVRTGRSNGGGWPSAWDGSMSDGAAGPWCFTTLERLDSGPWLPSILVVTPRSCSSRTPAISSGRAGSAWASSRRWRPEAIRWGRGTG